MRDFNRLPREHWARDYANVAALASWLIENRRLTTPQETLDYFVAAWKWEAEWNELQLEKLAATGHAIGRTDEF